MAYRVMVDDNFHHMDEDERYELGTFRTSDAALEAARRVVDEFLLSAYVPGRTADQLFAIYVAYGEDPFILSEGVEKVSFSAWGYARERCAEMCGTSANDKAKG